MENNTFGGRLKNERKRLGLTQEKLAELGGVKKLAQISYEKDKTYPDVGYLLQIMQIGVDFTYLIAGEVQISKLSVDESQVVSAYRLIDENGKQGVRALLSGLHKKTTIENNFNGDVGQVIHGDVTAPQTFTFTKKTEK